MISKSMMSQIGLILMVLIVIADLNITNATNDDYYCRENYYGGNKTGLYDLLDRGHCD
jgi:hypothetical protein